MADKERWMKWGLMMFGSLAEQERGRAAIRDAVAGGATPPTLAEIETMVDGHLGDRPLIAGR